MLFDMFHSKIHRATVTGADLHYEGSISIDEELLEKANMWIGQRVEIWNINNGERFSTYIIKGERGKREITLNGAASRKVHAGDKVIIVTYAQYTEEELKNYKPTVLLLDDENNITKIKREV
jgi:aspartate 1-decarboxylase